MDPSSPEITPNKIPATKSVLVFLAALALSLLLALISYYAYQSFFSRSQKTAEKKSTKSVSLDGSAPVDQLDLYAGWEWYLFKSFGLEFRLPKEISSMGPMKEEQISGEKGKVFCMTLLAGTSFLTNPVYAGGAGCYVGLFGLGGPSEDFEAGREKVFTDYVGYVNEGDRFFALLPKNKRDEIPNNLVEEVVNPNGIKVLLVKGADAGGEGNFPQTGTPGNGWIGALVNLPEGSPFHGLAVQMKLEASLNEIMFKKIISTLRYLLPDSDPDYGGWAVYRLDSKAISGFDGFRMYYPLGWSINVYQVDNDNAKISSVELKKDNSVITIVQDADQPKEPGCLFKGDQRGDGDYKYYETYKEVNLPGGVVWRTVLPGDEKSRIYSVCEKDSATETFKGLTRIGKITFLIGSSDWQSQEEVSKIINSISFIKK